MSPWTVRRTIVCELLLALALITIVAIIGVRRRSDSEDSTATRGPTRIHHETSREAPSLEPPSSNSRTRDARLERLRSAADALDELELLRTELARIRGDAREAFEFLKTVIARAGDSFQRRVVSAHAARFIPYAVSSGEPDLREEALQFVIELLSSKDEFIRVGASAALTGHRLSILTGSTNTVFTVPEIEADLRQPEAHGFLEAVLRRRQFTDILNVVALQDPSRKVREQAVCVLAGTSEEKYYDTFLKILASSNDGVDTKEYALKGLSKFPSSQTVDVLKTIVISGNGAKLYPSAGRFTAACILVDMGYIDAEATSIALGEVRLKEYPPNTSRLGAAEVVIKTYLKTSDPSLWKDITGILENPPSPGCAYALLEAMVESKGTRFLPYLYERLALAPDERSAEILRHVVSQLDPAYKGAPSRQVEFEKATDWLMQESRRIANDTSLSDSDRLEKRRNLHKRFQEKIEALQRQAPK